MDMRQVLKSQDDAPYEEGRDFSVTIFFDDSTSAERADDVLELLEENLKQEAGRLFHQWWNTEVLALASLREQAAAEAAWADMIIIVLREAARVARGGRRMDEAVPGSSQEPSGSDGRPAGFRPSKPDERAGNYLATRQAAALGNMDFFATRGNLRRTTGLR